ncbi:MAG: short-chain dehydrogenase [Hyphomonas sp. 32-62-5]|nr:MAG: short-chain dehydrogenase [Hyphomonas sp. 32-62-5]
MASAAAGEAGEAGKAGGDPLFDFSGKTVLITGGSRGLGRQMVNAFAARGADVIIASRKIDACEEAAAQVRTMGRRALAIGAHCGRWDEVDGLIERAYAAFGRIDILVNNAGMGPKQPSAEVSEANYDSVLNLNLKGPFRLAARIGKRMADGDGGAIINISSIASFLPMPQVVCYAMAKAGLNAMTVSLAAEYAPRVRVNAICAGPFLTDISQAWTQEMRDNAATALGRNGDPAEIVTSALYLASPASSFTTGTLLRVDGGGAG